METMSTGFGEAFGGGSGGGDGNSASGEEEALFSAGFELCFGVFSVWIWAAEDPRSTTCHW